MGERRTGEQQFVTKLFKFVSKKAKPLIHIFNVGPSGTCMQHNNIRALLMSSYRSLIERQRFFIIK